MVRGPSEDRDEASSTDEGAGSDDARPSDARAEPIIGGSEANGYPEAVLVGMKNSGVSSSVCSGAMIAPKVVLTAGHCVAGFDGWTVKAPYAGNQSASSSQGVVYDYTTTDNYVNANQHDVGLLVLDSAITLPTYPVVATSAAPVGTNVVNVGRIDNGQMSYTKLFVSQPLAIQSGSSKGFPFAYVTAHVIQPGDSGGPDLIPGPAPRTIVAVNSGAGDNWQILARVDLVASWIGQQVAANGGDSPPSQPPSTPASCAHALCDEGGKLVSSCDPCVAQVCAQDAYCCSTAWDNVCVSEVASICGQSCSTPPPSDPCNGITYAGQCDAGVLSWCENNQLQSVDCGAYNKQCGWDGGNGFYNCL
jgi:hypothetical protein